MRKYYVDNIRILCIFLLFPFHTAMIFNGLGEKWYVNGKELWGATILNLITYPWWMSLLFVLAGMSTVYAFKRRSSKEYAMERVKKLLIPFISAIVLLVPVQSYIADKYFNNYKGNYIEHFKEFFTISDLSGYDGHLTPGHTWFILYLFVISMLVLPILIWYKNKKNKINGQSITMVKLIPMFLIILLATPILEIGGKSIGEFTTCFLLGYFILSIDEVQNKLEKYCIPLGIAWIALMISRCIMYECGFDIEIVWDIHTKLFSWCGILAVLGLGKKFLNFNSRFTQYFAPAAFPLYLFHQSIIVIEGYFLVNTIGGPVIQYFIIMIVSFILTIVMYEVCRRLRITRFLFGIKNKISICSKL